MSLTVVAAGPTSPCSATAAATIRCRVRSSPAARAFLSYLRFDIQGVSRILTDDADDGTIAAMSTPTPGGDLVIPAGGGARVAVSPALGYRLLTRGGDGDAGFSFGI